MPSPFRSLRPTAPSNWRAQKTLREYLVEHGIPAIQGIDTRALVRRLRDHGAQEAVLSTRDLDRDSLVAKAKASPGLVGRDLVREVTCTSPYDWTESTWDLGKGYRSAANGKGPLIVAYDYGIKRNILRNLVRKHGQGRHDPELRIRQERRSDQHAVDHVVQSVADQDQPRRCSVARAVAR